MPLPRSAAAAAALRERERELEEACAVHCSPLLRDFVRDGAVAWSFDAPHDATVLLRLRELAQAALEAPVGRKRHKSERRGYEIPLEGLSSAHWAALFPPSLLCLLREYLKGEPAVVSVALIVAPAHAPPQEPHRDHGGGPRRSVCLILSTDPSPVTTLVAPGSHARSNGAREWGIEQLRPLAGPQRGLLYDNFVVHAGAANERDTPLTQRVFFAIEPAAAGGARDPLSRDLHARIRAGQGYSLQARAVPLATLTGLWSL